MSAKEHRQSIITYNRTFPKTIPQNVANIAVQNNDKPAQNLLKAVNPRPFVKWPGGKTKLLPTIEEYLPTNIRHVDTYIEPFVGAGSVFLYMMQNFDFNHVIINDINQALIATYKCIRDNPDDLMREIDILQNEYTKLPKVEESDDKSKFYYNIRNKFNDESRTDIMGCARFMFLNKYCYNGLYRENKSGGFNASFNHTDYKNIYDPLNIKKINQILNLKNKDGGYKVTILNGDYKQTLDYAKTTNAFIYMDPPYRPVSASAFTAYHKSGFNDDTQRELKDFCIRIHQNGAGFMLSNSDPKIQKDALDPDFFDELYEGCSINRVSMPRYINSKGSGRGKVSELLITNYQSANQSEKRLQVTNSVVTTKGDNNEQ